MNNIIPGFYYASIHNSMDVIIEVKHNDNIAHNSDFETSDYLFRYIQHPLLFDWFQDKTWKLLSTSKLQEGINGGFFKPVSKDDVFINMI